MPLQLVGSIELAEDRNLSRDGWLSLMASFGLESLESCEVYEPFIRESFTMDYPGELGAVMVEGEQAGVLRWAPTGTGLDVYGDRDSGKKLTHLTEVATRIARDLNGEYELESD